jgi:hypothetical protein
MKEVFVRLARLAAQARWTTSAKILSAYHDEAKKLIAEAIEAGHLENRSFGEVRHALARQPWVTRLTWALVESQTREPLDETHSVLVRLRNLTEAIRDALNENPARARTKIIRDQFRIGRHLLKVIAARFLTAGEDIVGNIDLTDCQSIVLAGHVAFYQSLGIATAEPFGRLLELLDKAGVPNADRVLDPDAPDSPVISGD